MAERGERQRSNGDSLLCRLTRSKEDLPDL
jgi:hypothetical protein